MSNCYLLKYPIKRQKKDDNAKNDVQTEKERIRNEIMTKFQKMNMPKINHGPGLVPDAAVVDTGKFERNNVYLDVSITTDKIHVEVFANHVDLRLQQRRSKIYDFIIR